jgi:hypothetical protein
MADVTSQGVLGAVARKSAVSDPPTFFASTSTPADNGFNGVSPTSVTPPSSMLAGDLVIMNGAYRGSSTMSVSETGGQSWTIGTNFQSASISSRIMWCTFNGTWTADPSLSSTQTTGGPTAVLNVFRPSSTSHVWTEHVSVVNNSFSAPSSPFDISAASITTTLPNAIAFYSWVSADNNTYSLQTAGWSHVSSNQYRNGQGGDSSVSPCYKIMETAGATGAAVNRQTSVAGDLGVTVRVAFV